ncbi:MAG: NAD(P)/FAD-dependent oxidoreductase [Microbacterium sp.]|uniref:NAD(P)/FAD-dependent oxidoreductase n=1 Tax=Microbacterium sp. TaxID=51671 RepID=UPI0027252F01|nr:NAD(P)/FAD-dependent oxidoreductase [Microbacterium sp.]MDO8382038.1 NAD(P)/FAD-dependent oxidoreductase [Microbacterium sp.]
MTTVAADSQHDVVVIGAGLAGLRASIHLAQAGYGVVLVEAGDAVGGRQRTDAVDGFLLDRGFQVLNPAYPAVRRWAEVRTLGLRSFPAGVQVRRERGLVAIADPLRHPTSVPASLRSGLITPRGVAGLARWLTPALIAPRRAGRGSDRAARDGWDRAGFSGPLRDEVLEPFLSGVIADDRFETSDAFVRMLVRLFALGSPGLPERGIQALPTQLATIARGLSVDIRLGHSVRRLSATAGAVEVHVAGADTLRAGAVIVAVSPEASAELTGRPGPATRGLQTWWFQADAPPTASGMLAVDGRRRGPIVNTAVISHTAPTYAPPGQHLIEATCLLPGGDRAAPDERAVRAHLNEIWGTDAGAWRILRRDDIPHALPAQLPPLRARAPRVSPGVYVAGDHCDTASIQGALVSGDRAARAVIADLSG